MSAWDKNALNLYTIKQFLDLPATNNYSRLKYLKFLSIIANSHDNDKIRNDANALLAKYKTHHHVDHNPQISIIQELQEMQNLFLDNIKNNLFTQKKIDDIHDENARIAYYKSFHLHIANNVNILQRLFAIRLQIATENGYKTWSSYKTNNKVSSILLKLYNLRNNFKIKARNDLSLLIAENNNKEIYAYNQKYFEKKYKTTHAPFIIDSYIAINCTLAFICKKLGYVYTRTPISNYWTSTNVPGNYQFAINKNGILRGIILVDSSPRKNKSATGFTEQIVVECNKSPNDEVSVCYVSVSHEKNCNYADIVRLMHEFGHAFDIIGRSSKEHSFEKSGLNGIAENEIEKMSQGMEIYTKNAISLSEIIMKPRDVCNNIININKSFYNIDWACTIAKAIYDLEMHDMTRVPSTKEIIEWYNEQLEDAAGIIYPRDVCAVANFNHLADYSANYYTYISAEFGL
jgi:Zn-dependent oligopeptidase